jgi:Do/DeqQ family serine protease
MMMSLAPVVDRASPAVVNVYAARRARGPSILDDPVMRRFGEGLQDLPEGRISQSLGSGVIVRADGVIVTNNHVVQGADELKVVLADRREFDARLILSDPRTDLAVLQIVGADAVMPTLPFADTSAVKVGDMVLAIGNPFGLTQTVTSGIVSALARTEVGVSDFSFFIQTDAAINRGNSGGALVDMTGALVGVNTAIYSETGGSNGVGFAIPAEMVRRVVEAAVTEGRVVRPWLGARVEGVTQARARELGLSRPQGVIITAVYPGAAADAAGLTAGDVILRVGPVAIADEQGLRFQFATYTPGMQVPLTVRRNGQEETVLAPAQAPPAGEADARQLSGRHPLNGAVIVTLSPATADERGLDPFLSGVVITQVDGLRRDIRRGDIIRTVNGRSVQSASEVERALSTARGPITLGIEREGRVVELAYPA